MLTLTNRRRSMPTHLIDLENAKSIRFPFEVHCGMSSRDPDVNINMQNSSGYATRDPNISASIDSDWYMREVADLQGDGFPMWANTEWFSAGTASEDAGKLGYRSHIGGTMTFTIVTSDTVEAVTLEVIRGTGTAEANGVTYELVPRTVIPLQFARAVTVTVTSDDPTGRVEIASITPGVTLEFDNSSLISCVLDLQSDLSREGPSWPESSIDIQAYYPNDIEAIVSNMPEDTPIWYYSGYTTNHSDVRNFYLTGMVTLQNNILSIQGTDASHRLNDYEIDDRIMHFKATRSRLTLYGEFVSIIRSAGIKLRSRQTAPTSHGRSSIEKPLVILQQTAREFVASVMNLCHVPALGDYDPFWPTFVDAGIPTVYWTRPTSKWTIDESMVADHERGYERKISRIVTTNSDGIGSTLSTRSKRSVISETECEKGEIFTVSYDGYFFDVEVTNASIIKSTATEITFKAKKDGICKVTGYKVYVSQLVKRISTNQTGVSWVEEPRIAGKIYTANTDATLNSLFPAYYFAAKRNNIVGSFTFRGDPRMQPRDVFTFRHLSGTSELCTIQSIMLRHEGGGTTATITYRKGIC